VTQIGNAVAPPMAAALGRCLLLAAAKQAPVAEPTIYVSEPALLTLHYSLQRRRAFSTAASE
jgi:hypothetical protein